MKVVLLAGGLGTRISEESEYRPKPMVELGNMPILWHIMKEYSHYGFNEFIICAGYKQHMVKEWFADYFLYTSDITFDFSKGNEVVIHDQKTEPWKVTVVDTGWDTMTGGRLKRVRPYIGNETFMQGQESMRPHFNGQRYLCALSFPHGHILCPAAQSGWPCLLKVMSSGVFPEDFALPLISMRALIFHHSSSS